MEILTPKYKLTVCQTILTVPIPAYSLKILPGLIVRVKPGFMCLVAGADVLATDKFDKFKLTIADCNTFKLATGFRIIRLVAIAIAQIFNPF
jgi:hypothetical protein